MKKWMTYLIIAVVIAASVGGALAVNEFYFKDDSSSKDNVVVESGDQVTVHYTGWLKDERIYNQPRIFDSSKNVTGQTIVTFSERDRGKPFTFTVGKGVIEGWSDGVKGMKEGETKTFTVPPEKGYSAWSEDLIIEVDRTETVPVYEEMTTYDFKNEYGMNPSLNLVVKDGFWNWNQSVSSIEGETVILKNQPQVGKSYRTYVHESNAWTSEVISIKEQANQGDGEIKIRHSVDKRTIVDATHVSKHVEAAGNVTKLKRQIGQNPKSDGLVVEVGDKIAMDFNEEVNGKTLTFEIKVLDIKKA